MLALAVWREMSCNGCGGWLPETTEKEASGKYVVQPPIRCHRCDGFSHASEQAQKMRSPQSLILQVERRG